jgi:hypothetical protein
MAEVPGQLSQSLVQTESDRLGFHRHAATTAVQKSFAAEKVSAKQLFIREHSVDIDAYF